MSLVKIHRHNSSPLQSFLQPDSRFSAIHCDLVGPLPENCGHPYLLTFIDRFTRHLKCIPLREITAKACAEAFVLNWVARFGCPQIMTSDRGVQFTSHLWEELCKFLGCKLVHATAFHPESNGFLERKHRTLKAALKAQENPRDWFPNWGLSFWVYVPLPNLTSRFPLHSFVWELLYDYQGNSLSPLPRPHERILRSTLPVYVDPKRSAPSPSWHTTFVCRKSNPDLHSPLCQERHHPLLV